MYLVETDGQAKPQVDALPAEALAPFAELRVVLETSPWTGRSINVRSNPDAAVRVLSFGSFGQVVYLILEEQRRVDILMVQWAG